MKVLLLNGSPHEKGCTYTALHEMERVLQAAGAETPILTVGAEQGGGCSACGAVTATTTVSPRFARTPIPVLPAPRADAGEARSPAGSSAARRRVSR